MVAPEEDDEVGSEIFPIGSTEVVDRNLCAPLTLPLQSAEEIAFVAMADAAAVEARCKHPHLLPAAASSERVLPAGSHDELPRCFVDPTVRKPPDARRGARQLLDLLWRVKGAQRESVDRLARRVHRRDGIPKSEAPMGLDCGEPVPSVGDHDSIGHGFERPGGEEDGVPRRFRSLVPRQASLKDSVLQRRVTGPSLDKREASAWPPANGDGVLSVG